MNIELLNRRLNTFFNAFSVDDFGRIIAERELVGRVHNLKLYIYPNDHSPPHFHVVSSEIDASFYLESCEILKGSIDSKSYKKIKFWHKSSKDDLIQVWAKLNDKI